MFANEIDVVRVLKETIETSWVTSTDIAGLPADETMTVVLRIVGVRISGPYSQAAVTVDDFPGWMEIGPTPYAVMHTKGIVRLHPEWFVMMVGTKDLRE